MRCRILILVLLYNAVASAQPITRFETSGGKQTPTYTETISWWKKADASSPLLKMMEMGTTDAGYPLHLVLISTDNDFNIPSIKKAGKIIILINNGIHPGEPDGIDASMLLAKDIIQQKKLLPSQVILAIIPVYNIGGALNRSEYTRVDQDGPEEKGERSNSQNLDLNLDFIKCDTKEALSFTRIFHYLDPDVFIDNHVSNGADYQHTITLIETQHNKLGGSMGIFLQEVFSPALYASMKKKSFDLVPYVNHTNETPDKGWPEFWDSPRYSSGYAALWNTFSFVPETHMLKPYRQRVAATQALMQSFIEFCAANYKSIIQLRSETRQQQAKQTKFPIAWKWDPTRFQEILFKGYEPGQKTSAVSGLPRLFYDRTKPFQKKVPFYNEYIDTLSVAAPTAYLIPQGWWKVVERLQANKIAITRLARDTVVEVETYKIRSFQSSGRLFEAHRPNSNVQLLQSVRRQSFRKGDYLIPVTGKNARFLIETLEPQAEDSYFAWNFFDAILGQKEGSSDYAFEETAARYLASDPLLRARFDERKKTDSVFAKNGGAQLAFVYQNSPYAEKGFMQYPVYRILHQQK
ncbi:MAG: M14 family metallopeptidase [Chitinophagaceae bacterium]